ncbi:hypothetical protein [Brevibacterium ihuae]|uniref:hypothetical protein n=1 Tax=Brevibacterium ihuae TaxID=1631743 RepID=UPI000C7751C4|nr:hypothetical protein [Brevibacterium ihuae]
MSADPAALLLPAVYSAAEARSVLVRRLPGAEASATPVVHPYWWVRAEVRRTGLRRAGADLGVRAGAGGGAGAGAGAGGDGLGETVDVLVDVYSGRGFIAAFEPHGASVEDVEFRAALEREPIPVEQAIEVARNLLRTRVQRRWKLAMGYAVEIGAPVRGVLKPNWLVSGRDRAHAVRMLVDGLDGTHFVISAEAL